MSEDKICSVAEALVKLSEMQEHTDNLYRLYKKHTGEISQYKKDLDYNKQELRVTQQYLHDECDSHEETKSKLDEVKKIVLVDQYISYEDWIKLKNTLQTNGQGDTQT